MKLAILATTVLADDPFVWQFSVSLKKLILIGLKHYTAFELLFCLIQLREVGVQHTLRL